MIFGIFRRLEKENAKLEAKLSDLQSEYCELENFHNSEIKEMEAYNEKLLNSDIEKHNQIVLLKEENAKLKDIISNQSESLRITLLEEDNKAKRIKELEKEISELKEQNIKDCESFNKTMKEIKEQWNKEHYQLIKAKEIIRKYYKYNPSCEYSYGDIDKEAEQFLKESK